MKARVKSLEEIKEINSKNIRLLKSPGMESGMLKFCGKIIDIIELDTGNYECSNWWYWHPLWLEIIDENLREITQEEHDEIFRELVSYALYGLNFIGKHEFIIDEVFELLRGE